MNPIPFIDLRFQHAELRGELRDAFERVLDSGRFVLGEQVRLFEEEFAKWNESEFAIGVASGTDALVLALQSVGVGPGDEVITVANTAVATVNAICQTGAVPVFADICADTWLIDPKSVAQKISHRTKALVPVHLYGNPCDMEALLYIAEHHKLAIIEDCCQAHGASFRGRKVGNWGQCGCFSFYPTKNLGAVGDGGLIVTNDPALAQTLRRSRFYGFDEMRRSHQVGRNSRLDELQAALLRIKLRHLTRWNALRKTLASSYRAALEKLVPCQQTTPQGDHVYHLFVVLVEARDRVLHELKCAGIEVAVHYERPVYDHPAYIRWRAGGLPMTDHVVLRNMSLPLYPGMDAEDIAAISKMLKAIVEGKRCES